MSPANPKRLRLFQQIFSTILLLAAAGLVGYLSTQHKIQQDWTAGNRNSLTPASRRMLQSMPDPIHFIAFLYPDSDLRREVELRLERYRRLDPKISIDIVDPSRHPDMAKQYEVQQPGEVIVEYQGRHETLHALSEPDVTGALERLAEGGARKVLFLTGHGELSIHPGGQGQSGLDDFAQALHDKGLRVDELNLVKTPAIPDDASVLIIASPSNPLLAGEDKLITDWVQKGGNLLWMQSVVDPIALPQLAQALGIGWQNGYAALADWERLNTGNPGLFLASDYPPNDVTQNFDQITLYPFVRPFTVKPPAGWDAKPLLRTDERSWLQTDLKEQPAHFHKGDLMGPLTLGETLSRPLPADSSPAAAASSGEKPAKARSQRVAVLGNVDFLADGNIRVGGNRLLGLDVVLWLAFRDAQISIDVPKAPDSELLLPRSLQWLIGVGFSLLLPAALIGFGLLRWARRRAR